MNIEVGATPYNQDNTFYLRWVLTNNCNLKCHYCDLHNQEKYLTKKETECIIQYINKKQKQYDIFELRLFGGEPTTHPNFINILQKIDPCSDFILSTNLQIPINRLQKIYSMNKITAYICSWHYNIIDNDMFETNLQYLLQQDVKVKLFLMLEKQYIDDILSLQKKYSHIAEIKIVRQDEPYISDDIKKYINNCNKKINYNSFEKKYYISKDNVFEYIDTEYIKKNNYHRNKYWCCSAISKNIFIDSNGDVYPCQTYAHHKKKCLGNILNNTYEDKQINIYCEFDQCGCELFIPKRYDHKSKLLERLYSHENVRY